MLRLSDQDKVKGEIFWRNGDNSEILEYLGQEGGGWKLNKKERFGCFTWWARALSKFSSGATPGLALFCKFLNKIWWRQRDSNTHYFSIFSIS